MKSLDLKYSLVHLEVEARMKLADLSAQLLSLVNPVSPTMEQFISIYTELCNRILEPLDELQNNVVSKMSEKPSNVDDSSV